MRHLPLLTVGAYLLAIAVTAASYLPSAPLPAYHETDTALAYRPGGDSACVHLARTVPPREEIDADHLMVADVLAWPEADSIRMPGHINADHSWWAELCVTLEAVRAPTGLIKEALPGEKLP